MISELPELTEQEVISNPQLFTTKELAELENRQIKSVHQSHWRKGSFKNYVPVGKTEKTLRGREYVWTRRS